MSKTSTRASCGDPGKPRDEPGRSRARTRFRPVSCAARGLVLPTRRRCHRTSDVSVITGLRRAFAHVDRRPSPLPAPSREGRRFVTNRDTFHQRGELALFPRSAAREPLARSRYPFTACGYPRTARPPSTTPATTGAASDDQAPPADFCNHARRTGTTCERPLLERTPLGALSVARSPGCPDAEPRAAV